MKLGWRFFVTFKACNESIFSLEFGKKAKIRKCITIRPFRIGIARYEKQMVKNE